MELPNNEPLLIDNSILTLVNSLVFKTSENSEVLTEEVLQDLYKDLQNLKDATNQQKLILEFFVALNTVPDEKSALQAWKNLQQKTEVIIGLSTTSVVDLGIIFNAALYDKFAQNQESHVDFLINNWEELHNIPEDLNLEYFANGVIPGPRQSNDTDIAAFISSRYPNEEVYDDPLDLRIYKIRLALIDRIISIPPESIPDSLQAYTNLTLREDDSLVDHPYALVLTGTYYYEPLLKALSNPELKKYGLAKDALFAAQTFLTFKLANQALIDSRLKVDKALKTIFSSESSILLPVEFYRNIYFGNESTGEVGINYAISQNRFLRQKVKDRLSKVYSDIDPLLSAIAYQVWEIFISLKHTKAFPVFSFNNPALKLDQEDRILNILTTLVGSMAHANAENADMAYKLLEMTLAQLILLIKLITLPNHTGIIMLSLRNRILLKDQLDYLYKRLKNIKIDSSEIIDPDDEKIQQSAHWQDEEDGQESEIGFGESLPSEMSFPSYFNFIRITQKDLIPFFKQILSPLETHKIARFGKFGVILDNVESGVIYDLSNQDLKLINATLINTMFEESFKFLDNLETQFIRGKIQQVKIGYSFQGNHVIPSNFSGTYPITPGSIREFSPQRLYRVLRSNLFTNQALWKSIFAEEANKEPVVVNEYYAYSGSKIFQTTDISPNFIQAIKIEGDPYTMIYLIAFPYEYRESEQPLIMYRPLIVTTSGYLLRSIKSIADMKNDFPSYDNTFENQVHCVRRMTVGFYSRFTPSHKNLAHGIDFLQKLIPAFQIRELREFSRKSPNYFAESANAIAISNITKFLENNEP